MTQTRPHRTLRRSLATVAVASAIVLTSLQGLASAGTLAATALTGQASSSGFPAGSSIYDSASLGMGNNPTGTLTFKLYTPGNTTCSGTPAFTSTKPVNGNGYYESAYFATTVAGTYRWVASYSGDANNAPDATACADSTQAVSVAKRTPTLNTEAVDPSRSGSLVDTATLGGGVGPSGPTGTITFKLFGPDNMVCSGTPVLTSTKTVTGNGTYTSDPFTPSAVGTYRWMSQYSGDANNFGAQTICADPAQAVTVTSLPKSQTARFVDSAFYDLLGRMPTPAETTLWVPLLDLNSDRTSFAASLTASPEFRQRAIEKDYRTYLGRSVDSNALAAFLSLLADGWPLEIVTAIVVGSDEFYKANGGTPSSFVDALYRKILGTTPDPTGRTQWINQLNQGVVRNQVVFSFLDSRPAHAHVVDVAYRTLLDRQSDSYGCKYWTDHMDNGLRQDHLFAFLVGSPDYLSKV